MNLLTWDPFCELADRSNRSPLLAAVDETKLRAEFKDGVLGVMPPEIAASALLAIELEVA